MLNSHQVKIYFSLNFLLLFFLVPINAYAAWYWVSVPTAPQTGYFIEEVSPNTIGYTGTDSGSYGDKTITPTGFMDVMDDTKDSNKCSAELDSAISQLRNFDSSKAIQPTGKCYGECGPYFTQETMAERESLLSKLKSSAEQCLVKEEQSIQQAEEERQRKAAEEKRLKEVTEAVADCDFDFFYNEMTDKERMETWEQREACKAKDVAETINEPVVKPSTPFITPAPAIQPTMLQNPVVTPLSNTPTYTPSESSPAIESIGAEELDSDNELASSSAQNFEAVEVLNPPQTATESAPAPEQIKKPNVFVRVFNFFKNLF